MNEAFAGFHRPTCYDPATTHITAFFDCFEPVRVLLKLEGRSAVNAFLTQLDHRSLGSLIVRGVTDEKDWLKFKEDVIDMLSSPTDAWMSRRQLMNSRQAPSETVFQFGERLLRLARIGYKPEQQRVADSMLKDALFQGLAKDEIAVSIFQLQDLDFRDCLNEAIRLDSTYTTRAVLKDDKSPYTCDSKIGHLKATSWLNSDSYRMYKAYSTPERDTSLKDSVPKTAMDSISKDQPKDAASDGPDRKAQMETSPCASQLEDFIASDPISREQLGATHATYEVEEAPSQSVSKDHLEPSPSASKGNDIESKPAVNDKLGSTITTIEKDSTITLEMDSLDKGQPVATQPKHDDTHGMISSNPASKLEVPQTNSQSEDIVLDSLDSAYQHKSTTLYAVDKADKAPLGLPKQVLPEREQNVKLKEVWEIASELANQDREELSPALKRSQRPTEEKPHEKNHSTSVTVAKEPHSLAKGSSLPEKGPISSTEDSLGKYGSQLMPYWFWSRKFNFYELYGMLKVMLNALVVASILLGMSITNPHKDGPIHAKGSEVLLEDYPRSKPLVREITKSLLLSKLTVVSTQLTQAPLQLAKLLLDSGKDPPKYHQQRTFVID